MLPRAPVFLCLALLSACGGGGGPDGGMGGGTGGGFAGPSDGGLDLNDVSFLFPLPAPGNEGQLLGLDSSGPRGALLPRAFFDTLPVIVEGADAGALFARTRVVGVRVDPCFPGSAPPAPPSCVKQLRLVAQPVLPGGADAGFAETTEDATIHLFYALDDAAFDEVHRALWRLKDSVGAATDGKPLDVHPVMAREGLSGAYASAVKELVRQHCGAQNLTRVAFMSVAQFGRAWRFGAFDVAAGALEADAIPRLNGLTAQNVQEFGTTEFRNGALLPSPPGDDLDTLLSESTMRLADPGTLGRALTSALRIEHPERESPKTIDCGSCHVASRARRNAEVRRGIDNSTHADAFHAPARFNLMRVDGAGDDPNALRAFGYFGSVSALSQRTINESAAVAEALSLSRP
ncbi:MAG: hypothetical protein AB1938_13770 [Myxococcota bacterium]